MQRPLNWWISIYLVLAALRGLILGISGLVIPAAMPIPFELTPLNARFVAAFYFAGSIGLLLTLFVRKSGEARPFLFGIGAVTGLLLAITVLRWSEFEVGPSGAFVVWFGSYLLDPLVIMLLLTTNALWRSRQRTPHPLAAVLYLAAAALGILGLALLFVPEPMVALWPWKIAPFLAQLYSCYVLAFAVFALLAAHQGDPTPIRNVSASCLVLMLLVLLASLLHLGRFIVGPATLTWFVILLLGIATFGWALFRSLRMSEMDARSSVDWSVDSGAPNWW